MTDKTSEIKAASSAGYKYELHDPIEVLGVKYDKMIFLVKEEDKAAFDNVGNALCTTVKLQFDRIDSSLNIPVFTVMGFGKNEEVSKMLEDGLENGE